MTCDHLSRGPPSHVIAVRLSYLTIRPVPLFHPFAFLQAGKKIRGNHWAQLFTDRDQSRISRAIGKSPNKRRFKGEVMGINDWSYLTDGLDVAAVNRGATAGIQPPPGGGNIVFAINSLAIVDSAVGLFVNLPDFAPMSKGGSIRGCIQRGPGGGSTGFYRSSISVARATLSTTPHTCSDSPTTIRTASCGPSS